MLDSAPVIATYLDAIDELDDIRCDMEGLARITLALGVSGIAEKESLYLIAALLDHYALCLDAATAFFEARAA